VVAVGYFRVGRRIVEQLNAHGIPDVVAEQNREVIEALRMDGAGTVFFGEEELAKEMTSQILQRFAPQDTASAPAHG
jgi:voltage-gated potassium channel Kch